VTFKEYLEAQVDRADLVGDFARDAIEDHGFPHSTEREDYVAYLPDDEFLLGIFAAAWDGYTKQVEARV
jgi:uncharacterized protein YozE (UPF0346 family)